MKLGGMYIGNDIDADMTDVVMARLSKHEEWRTKDPSFWIAEWRTKISWSIFGAQVPAELEIVELEESEEGTLVFV